MSAPGIIGRWVRWSETRFNNTIANDQGTTYHYVGEVVLAKHFGDGAMLLVQLGDGQLVNVPHTECIVVDAPYKRVEPPKAVPPRGNCL